MLKEGSPAPAFQLLSDPAGRITRIFPRVKVAGHIDEVLAAL